MKAHLLIVCLLTTLAHATTFPRTPSAKELVVAVNREIKATAFPTAPNSKELVMVAVREIKVRAEIPHYKAIKAPTAAMVAAGRIRSTRWVDPVPEPPEYRVPAYSAPTATEPVVQIGQLAGWPGLDRNVALPVTKLPAHPTLAEAVGRLSPRSITPHPAAPSQIPADLRSLAPIVFSEPSELMAATKVRSLPGIAPMAVDPFMLQVELMWNKPHGQWMNQMLKDIAAAKAAGDTETYNTLTARYAAWAEKYLRRAEPPNLDGLR